MVLSGYQLGEVGAKRYLRGDSEVQQRNGIQRIGQPLALLLPVQVQSPEGVFQGFCPHGDLCRQRLFVEVLERAAEYQVLGEVVIPVHAEEGLALHTIGVVALHVGVDFCL